MTVRKEINRKTVFSIQTQLESNECYQDIYITEVELKGNLIRSMHFGRPHYCPETVYIPSCFDLIIKTYLYSLLFALAPLKKFQNRFLIFGLGGGWAPMFLQKHFPDSIIDIVEIDGAVLTAAKHMGFSQNKNIHVIIQSLDDFLADSNLQQYDLIFYDISTLEGIRQWQVEKLRDMLVQKGVLLFNFYAKPPTLEKYKKEIETLQAYFDKIHIFKTTEYNINFVCHGSKKEEAVDINLENYTDLLWNILPEYQFKKKAEEKLQQYYITSLLT